MAVRRGRKPPRVFNADLPIDCVPSVTESKPDKGLGNAQRMAAVARVAIDGASQRQAGDEAGMSQSQVSKLMSRYRNGELADIGIEEFLDQYRKHMQTELADLMSESVVAARDAVRARVARDALDYTKVAHYSGGMLRGISGGPDVVVKHDHGMEQARSRLDEIVTALEAE